MEARDTCRRLASLHDGILRPWSATLSDLEEAGEANACENREELEITVRHVETHVLSRFCRFCAFLTT